MISSPKGSDVTPESPWLGLRSFGVEDAAYFHGREKELKDLYERVLYRPLTILFGQSGWGKTSLLRAGLFPRLPRGRLLPVPVRLAHEPGAGSLAEQVILALLQTLAASESPASAQAVAALAGPFRPANLWLLLHDPQYGLTGRDPDTLCPVFVFDQFEEVFTLGDKPERREASAAFRDALASLVENRPDDEARKQLNAHEELADRIDYQARHYRVLISLRYDFLHLLERWRKQMPSVMDNRMELLLLGGVPAFEAVVCPGRMRENRPPIISDTVGQSIVRFVAGVSAEVPLEEIEAVPPLLSLVCAELNAHRLEIGEQEISQSQFEGGSSQILESFYERSFDAGIYGTKLEGIAHAQETLRALRRLVERRLISADGFRESIAFDTMLWELSDEADAKTAEKVLGLLVDRRLLSVEERGGVKRLELTHDVLTRIAKASRDLRQETEAVELARLEQEKAEARTREVIAEKNRFRRLAIIAVVCAVVAALGASFGILGMIRAQRAAAEASRGFGAAREATDTFLARTAGEDLAYVPGIQGVREAMASKAIAQYQAMLATRPQDTDLRLALAKALQARAKILSQIGSVAEAEAAFKEALAALNALLKIRDTDEVKILVANAENEYGGFRFDGGLPGSVPLMKSALERVEPFLRGKRAFQCAAIYAIACNRLGNEASERAEKIHWFQRGRETAFPYRNAGKKEDLSSQNLLLLGLTSTTWNLGRQLSFQPNEEDKKQSLELFKQGKEFDAQLKNLQPDSPTQQKNSAISYQWEAEDLKSQGRSVEARQMFTRAVILWRTSSQGNPSVTLYHSGFVETLKDYGIFLSRLGDHEAARAAYQEAVELTDKIVGVRAERPASAVNLLQVTNQLAEFEQRAGKGDPEAATNTRSHLITIGRELVARYPDSLDLCAQHALDLVNQASNQPVTDRPEEAAPLLREALSLLDQQRSKNPKGLQAAHVENYLRWSNYLNGVLEKLAEGSESEKAAFKREREFLLDHALTWEPLAASYDAKQLLLEIAKNRGKLYLAAKDAQKAIALHQRMIALTEKSLLERPYYWYLRQSIAAQYFSLADAYWQKEAVQEEILARQTAIQIGLTRDYGPTPFEEVLNPKAAPTPEFLERIRTVLGWKPKQKMLALSCEVNGVMTPFQFYIHGGIPQVDFDPLADQAAWLKEEWKVDLSEKIRKSIRDLADIARKYKSDFIDVMDYALKDKGEDDNAELAKLRQDAGIKVGQVKVDPENQAKRIAAASALEMLGDYFDNHKRFTEAETQFTDSLKLLEKLPESTVSEEHLAPTYWKLAKIYQELKQNDNSLKHFLIELRLVRERAEAAPSNDSLQSSLATSLENLREIYKARGSLPEALENSKAAVRIREQRSSKNPNDSDCSRELAVTLERVQKAGLGANRRTMR